ncbi:MAG: hypothetical protein ACYTGF_02745 [Planctomycetota bacterium]|jgi:hypothetical protein
MRASRAARLARNLAAAFLAAGVIGGCYEEHAPSPQQQPAPGPATVEQPPPTGGPATGSGGGGGSALGGARRSAHNTVDSLEEKQKELEKALEDN